MGMILQWADGDLDIWWMSEVAGLEMILGGRDVLNYCLGE